MAVRFRDGDLEELERDARARSNFPPEVVRMFRRRVDQIRQAPDERDFYTMRSYRFEKLSGNRGGQHSIRLNDQWRLIVEFEKKKGATKAIYVVEIADCH